MLTLKLSRSASAMPGLVAGLLIAVVLLLDAAWWIETALAVSLASAVLAAASDAATGEIPDHLVVIAAVPVAVAAIAAAMRGDSGVGAGVAMGIVGLAAPLAVIHVSSPPAMGFGDVKLAVALGAGLGLIDARAAVLALCIASAATVAVAAAGRRASVPFGPGLVLGTVVSLMLVGRVFEGQPLWH